MIINPVVGFYLPGLISICTLNYRHDEGSGGINSQKYKLHPWLSTMLILEMKNGKAIGTSMMGKKKVPTSTYVPRSRFLRLACTNVGYHPKYTTVKIILLQLHGCCLLDINFILHFLQEAFVFFKWKGKRDCWCLKFVSLLLLGLEHRTHCRRIGAAFVDT